MRDRLKELENEVGVLTPDVVLKDAKNPKSVLHAAFDWDDRRAAHRYRLHQARVLIANVQYVYKVGEVNQAAPYYVRNPEAGTKDQGYVSLPRLRTDKELAHEALVEEFSRAAAHLNRAREIARALAFEEEEIVEIHERVGILMSRVHMEERTEQ